MYTKTNMIKTLEKADMLLKAGYIKRNWICRDRCYIGGNPDNGLTGKTPECCAEGAISIAAGKYKNVPGFRARSLHGYDYSRKLINLVDAEVAKNPPKELPYANSIISVNDYHGSTYKTVSRYFKKAMETLKNG